jgi:plastocyanin
MIYRIGAEKSQTVAFAAGITMILASVALAQLGPRVVVSQRGRAFQPGDVVVGVGDTVEILNDDGDLLHHAYIESEKFNFDSGDQQPGSRTDINFPMAGEFTVLCGIHPKMKLSIHVK